MGPFINFPFNMNNDDGDSNPFGQQGTMEEYKKRFENNIRGLIYKILYEHSDDFINEKFIPNRIKKLNELIKDYEINEEYEKCGFLNGLKRKIEKQEKIIK